MAFIKLTTTQGAISALDKQLLITKLGKLTYTAEGFADSKLAPHLTWVTFNEIAKSSFSTAGGLAPAPLYYVEITSLAGAMSAETKQKLGEQITQALLNVEEVGFSMENLTRVWVRFSDVADGNLVVGGQSSSLDGLRGLMASAA